VDVQDAVAMAEGLLAEHGLVGWTVVLDGAKTRAGVCRPGRREIGLSRPLTQLHAPEEVRDTVLHEVAHALVGTGHGHDAVWRATARRIGCTGRRTTSAPRPPGPWTGRCAAGHTSTRHRRPVRVVSCARCAPAFAVANLLTWTHHGREVPPAQIGADYAAEWRRVHALPGPGQLLLPGPRLPVGARVRLGGGGRHAGATGVVVKRGRTRYHVRTRAGVLTAPFALVSALGPE